MKPPKNPYQLSWPTTEQIANLAAALQQADPGATYSSSISSAIQLWRACKDELSKLWEETNTPPTPDEELPKPKGFPVPLEEFLRLALVEKRPEDRMPIFKFYLAKHLKEEASTVPYPFRSHTGPTDHEVETAVRRFREDGIDEAWFKEHLRPFRNVVPEYSKLRLGERARKGAQAKKMKAMGKKSLGGSSSD